MKIVECVANISEGSDKKSISAIAHAAESAGAAILDIDSGKSAGRSVITFACKLEDMQNAAVKFISKAAELIDMRTHNGVHPCIGAADVIPFVPLGKTTIEECSLLAKAVAQEVGTRLHIPTFLYGPLAPKTNQNKLSTLRKGGYPQLAERLKSGEITPDFGGIDPTSTGGTIIGVRSLMLAYNINLADDNISLAKEIAALIRTSGKIKKDAKGNTIYNKDGTPQKNAGIFPNCEAIGWYIEDFKCAQISTNIRSIGTPHIHEVYETVKKLAQERGGNVTGSEIIGLLPLESLLEAQKYYRNKVDFNGDFSAAISGLGLSDVKPFDASLKVLEHRLVAFNLI